VAVRDARLSGRRIVARLCATLAVVAVTVLAAEGLVSLAYGRSLLRRLPELLDSGRAFDLLAPSAPDATAADDSGPYRLHPDPRVGLVLKSATRVTVARQSVETTWFGLRRPRHDLAADAPEAVTTVAVVGASIPFGLGVGDEETLAARLEELFPGTVRGWTVAIPRWSHANAVCFLLDHWPTLRPDVVLYMPYDNDLGDTPVVSASGYRRAWPDPANPRPWLPIDQPQDRRVWKRKLWQIRHRQADLEERDLGTLAIESDLAPESSRRFDAAAASIERLARRVEAEGARLALLLYEDSPHDWHLLRRLYDRGLELPVIPLFRKVAPELQLGWDPHPNARTQQVMAQWAAAELVRLGWLEVAANAEWPEIPGAYLELRAPARPPAELRRLSDRARRQADQEMTAEVDFVAGRGSKQVYGGLTAGGLATTGLLAMLPRGDILEVEVHALEYVGIYPIEVGVEVDGRRSRRRRR
jgi:hypothetical protein